MVFYIDPYKRINLKLTLLVDHDHDLPFVGRFWDNKYGNVEFKCEGPLSKHDEEFLWEGVFEVVYDNWPHITSRDEVRLCKKIQSCVNFFPEPDCEEEEEDDRDYNDEDGDNCSSEEQENEDLINNNNEVDDESNDAHNDYV